MELRQQLALDVDELDVRLLLEAFLGDDAVERQRHGPALGRVDFEHDRFAVNVAHRAEAVLAALVAVEAGLHVVLAGRQLGERVRELVSGAEVQRRVGEPGLDVLGEERLRCEPTLLRRRVLDRFFRDHDEDPARERLGQRFLAEGELKPQRLGRAGRCRQAKQRCGEDENASRKHGGLRGWDHSPTVLVRPTATSNSLTRGTSMAARQKPNAPPVTRNGMNGSVDSPVPGRPMRMLVTL